jgi:hypothetical protein
LDQCDGNVLRPSAVIMMGCRAKSGILVGLLATASCLLSAIATAEPNRVLVIPTSVGDHADCSVQPPGGKLPDPAWLVLARRVDTLVTDAVEDAGMDAEMRLNAAAADPDRGGCIDDVELRTQAKQTLVIAPRIVLRDGRMILRIVAAAPNSGVMRLSTQEISDNELPFRAVVMVSELLAAEPARAASPKPVATQPVAGTLAAKPRSQGKGVLALTSAVLGIGVGYSLQRASGSDDPRLTYPLIALGAGLGIGASLIATEEWDVSVGEAWYLNAGMLWPTTSGLMLAQSYNVSSTHRYVYGLVGAGAGMSLAAVGLNLGQISEGGAVVAHSGGGAGLLLGGLVDMAYYGRTDRLPYRGIGYGSGIGVLLAGAAATKLKVSSSRVLFIDLAAGLGALTGAAIGSSLLIFKDEIERANRTRTWLALVGGSAVVGGGIGWYLTRGWSVREHEGSGQASLWPYLAATPSPVEGASVTVGGMTAGVQGRF